ncbi:Vacuolar protein sorting-associated protein 64 [Hanseniaspora uvarum DSM 2768]|nr:Vacuolar protein sorting-associated protein 64 [Hanseniaspora uvarum DSM 2768]
MSRARSNSNSVHNVQLNKPTENIFVEQKPMKNIDITNTLVVNDEETHIKPYNNIRIKPKINFVVKLVSLNNTFQKKSLTIPPPPDNLKLGRLLSSNNNSDKPQNAEGPSETNGYFESRILSRTHAKLSLDEDNNVLLTDLNSSNGSFLNDKKLKPQKDYIIKKGDIITLGTDIVPNKPTGYNSSNVFSNHGIHRRILALVEDILPIVDFLPVENKSLSNTMILSSLFGDLIEDVDKHKLLTSENCHLIDNDDEQSDDGDFYLDNMRKNENFDENELNMSRIYRFLKKQINMTNQRNKKLESINSFMENFTKDIDNLEKNKTKHFEKVKSNYYENINTTLTKKFELVQEKNFKILNDKNEQLEKKLATTKKENEDVVLKYEQEINKIKGVVEDLETKLQVAKVKNPKDSSDISSVSIKKEVSSDKETDIKQFIDKKLIENSNVDHTKKTHKIAYISSICVVGLISALMAYSQK